MYFFQASLFFFSVTGVLRTKVNWEYIFPRKSVLEKLILLYFVAFFHVASLLSTGVDNEKVGVDNEKALELD